MKITLETIELLIASSRFRFGRFLIAGALNTGFTYAIYLLLLLVFSYEISYTMAYISGIYVAFILNRFFVFKSDRGVSSAIMFPFVYIAQYATGMATLWIWIDRLGLSQKLAPLVAISITVPLTFLLSKFIFVRNAQPEVSGNERY